MKLLSRFDLTGKRALVTGSSRGIGAAIATLLAEAGANVIVNYAGNAASARRVSEQITALGRRSAIVQADLSDASTPRALYDAAIAELGGLDILVSSVATQHRASWNEVTRQQFDEQVITNWRSPFELIQLVAPGMIERKWGRILTIGSVQEAKPHPDMVVYAATKCAQTSMVQNLARQFGPHGVTINNLAPGVILTDRNVGPLGEPAYRDKMLARIPVADFGTAEDCASPALLLCSDAGRYITGQSLFVDGGMSL